MSDVVCESKMGVDDTQMLLPIQTGQYGQLRSLGAVKYQDYS